MEDGPDQTGVYLASAIIHRLCDSYLHASGSHSTGSYLLLFILCHIRVGSGILIILHLLVCL